MDTIGQAHLVIVILSDKYLRSSYCVAELYDIYRRALGKKEDFLRRIIPLVLDDARIGAWNDRVVYAKHWETEFRAMEQNFKYLGGADLMLYKAMKRWHDEVGDMLAYMNDMLHPHGFEHDRSSEIIGVACRALGGRPGQRLMTTCSRDVKIC
jgi:internalin A